MDHTVHLNKPRAAPCSFPGPFPGGAGCRRAAGCGFAFGSLLARHLSKFQKYICELELKQTNKSSPNLCKLVSKSYSSEELNLLFCFSPARFTHVHRNLSALCRSEIVPRCETLSLPLLLSRFLLPAACSVQGSSFSTASCSGSN